MRQVLLGFLKTPRAAAIAGLVLVVACSGPRVKLEGTELGKVRRVSVLVGEPKDFEGLDPQKPESIARLVDPDRLEAYRAATQFEPKADGTGFTKRHDTRVDPSIAISLADSDATIEVAVPSELAEKDAIQVVLVVKFMSTWGVKRFSGVEIAADESLSFRIRGTSIEASGD